MEDHRHVSAQDAVASATPEYLYLWLPRRSNLAEGIANLCKGYAMPLCALGNDGLFRLGPVEQQLSKVVSALGSFLDQSDTEAIRALVLPGQRLPDERDLFEIDSLQRLIGEQQRAWLSEILRGGTLSSHFQPIVRAADTRHIFGDEALLRVADPCAAPVPPMYLFSCARQVGLQIALDERARASAIATWGKPNQARMLFVNCTPSALEAPQTFLESTLSSLEAASLSPRRLVLEIVEMEQIEDLQHFKQCLTRYRQLGFRIALDDVGSGYSSLNLMHHLRPDFVKIDMDLVRDVHCDPYKATVTQTLLNLASGLSIQTIAEGVEDLDELAWLQRHGADFIQGYLTGKPACPPLLETGPLSGGCLSSVIQATLSALPAPVSPKHAGAS